MIVGILLRMAVLSLAVALFKTAWSQLSVPPGGLGVRAYAKSELLRRFDGDDDGGFREVDRGETYPRQSGIDVPILPDKLLSYTNPSLPSYLDEFDLGSLDNEPHDNPLTDAGATLGRVLFYDKQLSANQTISCASCHDQSRGFADPRQFSVGFEGGETTRNAMSLANLRYTNLRNRHTGFFWDERAASLEVQALIPIQDPVEMGMHLGDLENQLSSLPYYAELFEAAFGSSDVTSDRIAKALSQFMRSMVSFDSKFDRAAEASQATDLSVEFADFSAEENLGKSLFINGLNGVGELGCAHCHIPPTFGMATSINNGLDLEYSDQGLGRLDAPLTDPFSLSNDGKFKASALRNIALSAPYMHDGRFESLEEVVLHYSSGVHPHPNLGLAVEFPGGEIDEDVTSGLRLSARQQAALVAFLKTLTDESFVNDPRFSDPFPR